MLPTSLQRAWIRGALAVGGVVGRPLTADGQTMDPVMSALVRFANRMRANGTPDLAALRKRYAAAPAVMGLQPDRTVRVTATIASGRPARRYEPGGRIRADLLYFHGGGFIIGNLDTHDALCRRLAARAGLRITSVDYRLAPEHPFPAAYDDAAAAWRWARQSSPGPWLIGGDSAGANLAAGQALDGSARLQILLYPVVDMLHQDGRYPSIVKFQDGFLLTAEAMTECANLVIPPGQDAGDPRLSPIRADLGRASPALVVTAGFDPLRDQGRAFTKALQNAGVRAHLLEETGLTHGFADFAGVVPAARQAVDRIADAIRKELRPG
ncbi:MAG: alpha/beta hydrolase [Acetobacteraceae bacterium]|nr:alpha/beta hydrolase [Acetobacteraceae bacterium]